MLVKAGGHLWWLGDIFGSWGTSLWRLEDTCEDWEILVEVGRRLWRLRDAYGSWRQFWRLRDACGG